MSSDLVRRIHRPPGGQIQRQRVLAHTLHYGVGVFEGIRSVCVTTTAPRASSGWTTTCAGSSAVSPHLRAQAGPTPRDELAAACRGRRWRPTSLRDAYLRPIAYQDDATLSGLGSQPAPCTWPIAANPWGAYLGEDGPAARASAPCASRPTAGPARRRLPARRGQDLRAVRGLDPGQARGPRVHGPTTRPCSPTPRATWPRAAARTCSWCARARPSSRRPCPARRSCPGLTRDTVLHLAADRCRPTSRLTARSARTTSRVTVLLHRRRGLPHRHRRRGHPRGGRSDGHSIGAGRAPAPSP